MNKDWKDGELEYCIKLAMNDGDNNVGHAPSVIRSYLMLQSDDATRDGENEVAYVLAVLAHKFVEARRD